MRVISGLSVDSGVIGRAVGLFAATNIDDMVVLALFFAHGAGHRGSTVRIALGQYLGFVGILAVAVAGAFGATLLPESAIPYLGLLPLALGLRAAWRVWHDRGTRDDDNGDLKTVGGPKVTEVAAVTFANGGDNIGAYVPVFATAGVERMTAYVVVFLILVAGWVFVARFFATRPLTAKALARWGHLLLPVVLIGIGLIILTEGGAFGL
jgi:cadmium resistance protein CadD (predicted permease)